MMFDMSTQSTWEARFNELKKYAEENGHTRVPAKFVVENGSETIRLGSWVSYLRTRYRKNLLEADRQRQLESLPGWEWGPLRPGPPSDASRDEKIVQMHNSGMSLGSIGEEFGLTRQRVHQIVSSNG